MKHIKKKKKKKSVKEEKKNRKMAHLMKETHFYESRIEKLIMKWIRVVLRSSTDINNHDEYNWKADVKNSKGYEDDSHANKIYI